MEEVVTGPESNASRLALRPGVIVWMLGLSQIIGYGTLYYSFSILAESAATSFAWPVSWLYGGLSASLLLGGLVAPEVGRRIDRHGGASVMTVGSVGAAITLLMASLAPNGAVFTIAIIGTGVTGALVLYEAAFPTLVQATGTEARQSITHLTLIAGFASTIFWPLTAWLHGMFDWRQIYFAFAVANLVLCLPIHARLARQHRHGYAAPASTSAAKVHAPVPERLRRQALWLVTIGFALAGFALSAMLAQMVPMLTQLGLGASALVVSTLFGPAQVLVRFGNMLLGVRRHPIAATLVALIMVPAAIVTLTLTAPWTVGALLFAVLLGFGSGLKSIAQGTLPLALFGSGSYGARLGYMAAARLGLGALAPFVLASLTEVMGASAALLVMAVIGASGLGCMISVFLLARQETNAE